MTNEEINTLANTELPISYCKETFGLYRRKVWLLDIAAVVKLMNRMGYGPADDQYWDGLEHFEARFEAWAAR
jgi:hypothetical protein